MEVCCLSSGGQQSDIQVSAGPCSLWNPQSKIPPGPSQSLEAPDGPWLVAASPLSPHGTLPRSLHVVFLLCVFTLYGHRHYWTPISDPLDSWSLAILTIAILYTCFLYPQLFWHPRVTTHHAEAVVLSIRSKQPSSSSLFTRKPTHTYGMVIGDKVRFRFAYSCLSKM